MAAFINLKGSRMQNTLSFFMAGGRTKINHAKKKKSNPQPWNYVKGTQEPTEKAPDGQSFNNFRNKINKVLDYKPKKLKACLKSQCTSNLPECL